MNLLETYASLLPDWRTVFSQERAFVLALARARPPAHLRLAALQRLVLLLGIAKRCRFSQCQKTYTSISFLLLNIRKRLRLTR